MTKNSAEGDVEVTCPLKYSEEELAKQRQELARLEADIERKARVIQGIGAYTGWDRAVLPEDYNEMSKGLEETKRNFLDAEAKTLEEREQWAKVWPFQDR